MRARSALCSRFPDHTLWHTTVGRTPLDDGSARRRDLYLTTHNTHNRQHIHDPSGIQTRNPSKRSLRCKKNPFYSCRPTRRWEDKIKMDLREVGWGHGWIVLAQDGDRWRAVVTTVMKPGFYKMRGISWLAEKLLASQEGLRFMQFYSSACLSHC